MSANSKGSAVLLGVCIFLGLSALGLLLGRAAIEVKEHERSVVVKGLSEREYDADVVIWPIQFSAAENNLEALYRSVDKKTAAIRSFLITHGIEVASISHSIPAITDKSAQQWSNAGKPVFRYTAMQTVMVYSKHVPVVLKVMGKLSELGKQGIVFTGGNYEATTEYLFSRLNEVKPEMVEEATANAREVAQKFAENSKSALGKIRKASQGRFSITSRDKNNPQIKKVRVVSTVEYYLSD